MMCAGHSFWGRKAEDGPGAAVLPPPPLGHAGRVHQRCQRGRGRKDISGLRFLLNEDLILIAP